MLATVRLGVYIRTVTTPGAPNYFKTHRRGPLSAKEILKGVKATQAQIDLVERTLKELGLTEPKRAARIVTKRAPSRPRRSSKAGPRKSS